ncbi:MULTISPECIES: alpha/beta hydrolase [Kordiimonas]|jgi:hypothetical protein|uniref:alpha/beta hydrolase n=1 Tax=Kordiimonas TaxID=288021 RepID=UPI00257FEB81|nr:alpha/beta hydrolase-fold protein [Kordiimonas sp. UBA4487]
MKTILFSFVLLVGIPAAACSAEKNGGSIQSGQLGTIIGAINEPTGVTLEPLRRMRGEKFEWDHEIQVALPPSYFKTEKPYPVLWVVDGLYSFDRATRIVYSEVKKHLPEMIVVGIGVPFSEVAANTQRRPYEFSSSSEAVGFEGLGGYILEEKLSEARQRIQGSGRPVWSRTGGAADFLNFIIDEVRPVLAKEYRMSDDNTLYGHSGGGYFCTYALFARTESFSKYVCGSPNLFGSNFDLFKMEEQYANEHRDMKASVFFGVGESEILEDTFNGVIPAWAIVSSTARMGEILYLRKYPSLDINVRVFPSEDHISVIPLNLAWGLRTLWANDARNVEQ